MSTEQPKTSSYLWTYPNKKWAKLFANVRAEKRVNYLINTCIAEPRPEIIYVYDNSVKDWFSFFLLKFFKNDVWSVTVLLSEVTTNNAWNRNLEKVIK